MLDWVDDIDLEEIDDSYYVIEINSLSAAFKTKDILSKIKYLEKNGSGHNVILHIFSDQIHFNQEKIDILIGIVTYLSKKHCIVSLAITGDVTSEMKALINVCDAIALDPMRCSCDIADIQSLCHIRDCQYIEESGDSYIKNLNCIQKVHIIKKKRFNISTQPINNQYVMSA